METLIVRYHGGVWKDLIRMLGRTRCCSFTKMPLPIIATPRDILISYKLIKEEEVSKGLLFDVSFILH